MGDNRQQQPAEQPQTSDPVAQQLLNRYSGQTAETQPAVQDPTGASLLQRYESSGNVTPQYSSTEEPKPKTLEGSVQFWDFAKAKQIVTDAGIKRGWLGAQIQAKHGEGYEEAVKPSSEEEQATQTIEDFRKQNDLDNNLILNFAVEAGAGIPALIPFMGDMVKGAGIGAGALGGLGALSGIGALPMAGAGALLGGGSTLAQIIQGQSYLDMRAKGISHDHANVVSVISGGIQGGISMINLGGVGNAVGNAGKVALGSWSHMAKQLLTFQLKSIPEIGLAAAQQAAATTVNHISEGIAAILDGKPGASPVSLESAVTEYVKSFTESLAPFTGIIGAGKTLSFGTRATGRLMALSARRATRQVKAKLREVQGRVSELERQFEEEEAQREEQDLISEINKIAEAEAEELLQEQTAQKEAKQQRTQDAKEQQRADRQATKERAKVQRARDRVTELEEKIAEEEKALEAIEDEEEAYKAERSITKLQSKLLRARARLNDIQQGTQVRRPDRATVRAQAEAEVRRIVAAATSKFFAEASETRLQEARRILGLLKKLITSSDKLDPATKSRLLARAIEIDGRTALEKKGEKLLVDQISKEYETQVQDALDDVTDAVNFDAVKDGKSRFANHISEEFQQPTIEAFNTFKSFVQDELIRGGKNYQGLAKQALDAYHKAVEQGKDPLPYEMAARIGAEVIGLVDKSPEALHELAETIQDLKQDGLNAAAKKRIKEQVVVKVAREIALEELQAGEKVETDITQASPETLNKIHGSIKHAPSAVIGNLFTWKGMMRWASIFSKDPEAFLTLVDVHKPTQAVATGVREAMTLYHNLLAKHSPDGKFGTAVTMILKGVKTEKIGEYTAHPEWVAAEAGRSAGKKLTLSPNQAVKLWMQLKDRKADSSRIHGNGYTLEGEVAIGTSTEELLQDYFNRSDRKAYLDLANGLREFFDENFKRLSDAIWDEYGVRPEQNKQYSGYLSHETDKWDSTEDFAANWNNHVTNTVKPTRAGITIERVESTQPMAVRDAFTEVYQQIALFENWNVWRRAHVPLSAIFGEQGIRNVIKQKFGDNFLRSIDTARRDLVWGPQLKSEGWIQVYNSWLKQYAEVMLLARPQQFFKQATGFVGALQKMDERTLVEAINDFFKEPEKNWARLSSRDFFKNRFGLSVEQQVGTLIGQGFEDTKIATLKDYAAIPIKYGDRVSSAMTAHAIYYAAKKAGMSEAQALLEAEVFVNETQSSSTLDQLSNMGRNPYLKIFTLLTQQPTRRLEEISLDVARAVLHPTAENKLQAWNTTKGAGLAAMAFSGVGVLGSLMNPLASDNGRRAAMESFAVSFFDPVFSAGAGIGTATKYGTSYALNKALGWNLQLSDPSNPVSEILKESAQTIGDTIDFGLNPSVTNFAKITRDYLMGANIIIPGKPVLPVPAGMQKQLGGLTKVPVSGLPALEIQKALEGLGRKVDGE